MLASRQVCREGVQRMAEEPVDVLIVGAGPTGLKNGPGPGLCLWIGGSLLRELSGGVCCFILLGGIAVRRLLTSPGIQLVIPGGSRSPGNGNRLWRLLSRKSIWVSR